MTAVWLDVSWGVPPSLVGARGLREGHGPWLVMLVRRSCLRTERRPKSGGVYRRAERAVVPEAARLWNCWRDQEIAGDPARQARRPPGGREIWLEGDDASATGRVAPWVDEVVVFPRMSWEGAQRGYQLKPKMTPEEGEGLRWGASESPGRRASGL